MGVKLVVVVWRCVSCFGFNGSNVEGGICVVMCCYVLVSKVVFVFC